MKIYLLKINKSTCTKCNMCNMIFPGIFQEYKGHLIFTEDQYNDPDMQDRIKTATGLCLESSFYWEIKETKD